MGKLLTCARDANAFASTFLFLATHYTTAEKNKKELASQYTTTRQWTYKQRPRKKGERITAP